MSEPEKVIFRYTDEAEMILFGIIAPFSSCDLTES